MPKIKKTDTIDYARRNTITMRMDPYLLSHFTQKSADKPGSRTKAMERSMRFGEEFAGAIESVRELFSTAPETCPAHELDHWNADGTRMDSDDAAVVTFIKDAIYEKIARSEA